MGVCSTAVSYALNAMDSAKKLGKRSRQVMEKDLAEDDSLRSDEYSTSMSKRQLSPTSIGDDSDIDELLESMKLELTMENDLQEPSKGDSDINTLSNSVDNTMLIVSKDDDAPDPNPAVVDTRRRRRDGRIACATTRPARMSIKYGVSTRSWMRKKLNTTMTLLRELGIRTGLHFMLSVLAPNYVPLLFYNGNMEEHLSGVQSTWSQFEKVRKQRAAPPPPAGEKPQRWEPLPVARIHNLVQYDHADLRSQRSTLWSERKDWPAISYVSRGKRGEVDVEIEGRDPDVTCDDDPFFRLKVKPGVMSEPSKHGRDWVNGKHRRGRIPQRILMGSLNEEEEEQLKEMEQYEQRRAASSDGTLNAAECFSDSFAVPASIGETVVSESDNGSNTSTNTTSVKNNSGMNVGENMEVKVKKPRRPRSDAGVARARRTPSNVVCCKCQHHVSQDPSNTAGEESSSSISSSRNEEPGSPFVSTHSSSYASAGQVRRRRPRRSYSQMHNQSMHYGECPQTTDSHIVAVDGQPLLNLPDIVFNEALADDESNVATLDLSNYQSHTPMENFQWIPSSYNTNANGETYVHSDLQQPVDYTEPVQLQLPPLSLSSSLPAVRQKRKYVRRSLNDQRYSRTQRKRAKSSKFFSAFGMDIKTDCWINNL
jgi:hypothetical protein